MENLPKTSNGAKRNKIIIIILLLLILGIAGYALLSSSKKEEAKFEGKSFTTGEREVKEVLSLSGEVLSANVSQNFLMVKPGGTGNEEVKVVVSETTKLIKLTAPFDKNNPPPPGTQFTPKQTEIKLSGFKKGNQVLIISNKDVSGKTEIDDVSLVEILP